MSPGAMNARNMHELIPVGAVLEVLHPNSTLMFILLFDHGIQEAKKDSIIIILPTHCTLSKASKYRALLLKLKC